MTKEAALNRQQYYKFDSSQGGLNMKLRPHHLLCIQKFTGHGYHAGFTAHMREIVSALEERPQTQITVVEGCDEVCGRCPNRDSGACTSWEKVDFLDRAVLGICGLSYGENVPWTEAAANARERILDTEEFYRVCGGCQWFLLCRNTEV